MADRDMPPLVLSRLRDRLAASRGARRIDSLLSAENPAAAVAALAPPELFDLVHEVGFGDAAEVVALATPAQLRGCFDLASWDRDRVLLEPLKPWLSAVLDAGHEKVAEVWGALDAELRALIVQRQAVIYDLTLGEEPDDSDDKPLYFTVDRFFAVKLIGDEDSVRLLHQLLDDLYRSDMQLARHTLMCARSELATELEEMCHRWRSGRLADLGFVELDDALSLFRPLELDQVKIGEGTQDRPISVEDGEAPPNLPAPIAAEILTKNFLAVALDRILDRSESERLEQALVVLVNKVMSAAQVKPGDSDALRRAAAYAMATVSLGLETVSRGDLDRAVEVLASVSLTRLHRVGYTLTLKLARYARGLGPRARTAGGVAEAVVSALSGARPWMSRAVDEPPKPGARPFESQGDVRRAAEVLARLALRIAVVEALGVNLVAMGQMPEPRPALDDHIRTAMTRAMTGGEFAQDALEPADIAAFRTTCLVDGALTEEARRVGGAAVLAALQAAKVTAGREHLAALVFDWLGDIERGLGAVTDEAVDPRFVDGVIVAVPRT